MGFQFFFLPWVAPILISALFLGVYDVSKKHAVRENSVMPVLFLATFFGSLFFVAFSVITGDLGTHLRCFRTMFFPVLLKSCLVSVAWICMYYAMRELPVSIASPIGASSPLWVFIGGLILYHEIPTLWQAFAMLLVFCGYYLFSVFGKTEGVPIRNYRGIPLMIFGTLFNACSALWDKYLMGVLNLSPRGVQFWFSVDLVVILGSAWLIREKCFGRHHPFQFRWSVPLTGVLLILSDLFYFYGLTVPDTPISIVSLVRRSNCVVSFVIGGIWFQEKNKLKKSIALVFVLAGVAMLALKK